MAQLSGRLRVAADVGGTFIDFVAVDENDTIMVDKQPASADRLVQEFAAGLARLGPGEAVTHLAHGTTTAINTIVQEKGARVGLVTTKGFRDVLELGRGGRNEIYNWRFSPPPPLVPRALRLEVDERTLADGRILTAVSPEQVAAIADELAGLEVEAIAVCLLHSYANPEHELAVADVLRARLPGVSVTMSHVVAPEWREFERTSSTVLNAYVHPMFGTYLSRLTERLNTDGYRAPLAIMQSNGGVLSVPRAHSVPVRTLYSGPAGGVVASRALAESLGIEHAICADVGGTTFDVALVVDGDIVERHETRLHERPVLGATVDITSIGAGGGSVAWVDARGALKVGPESAGAKPGPACFGHGGTLATVTDAQLLLGFLDAERFLGGRMKLDVAAAEAAITKHVAEPLGLSLTEACLGIVRIAETNMANAVRAITVQRGLDPREFALITYGGGGGLFGASLAEELGVRQVVAPRAAEAFSAWGILASDYSEDLSVTRVFQLQENAVDDAVRELTNLAAAVTDGLADYGLPRDQVRLHHAADVRFAGQHHTVTVPIEAAWIGDPATLLPGVEQAFRTLHTRMYGPRTSDSVLEVVTLRVRGSVPVPRPHWPPLPEREPGPAREHRPVCLTERHGPTPVHVRDSLAVGQRVGGPAVVEEWANTVLVPAGWAAHLDEHGHLRLYSTDDATGAGR
ncbi:hydantoinase/oxoprolinase family protein [Prauserella cavernicola]|uniref:Hydantoinase/oxoprolinase family protein n=1 Tax=Prauserella cavernicola TaxID=2800127 RepID=A0A934QW48_9PSEU|nr:hydantoinase/oxoprolinase family protein [Prauserella cavernicola]MBK1787277.1 hydantoinase/oxoprolinase family protein [Prauserella cavernicola]